jgi:hypothetical protein
MTITNSTYLPTMKKAVEESSKFRVEEPKVQIQNTNGPQIDHDDNRSLPHAQDHIDELKYDSFYAPKKFHEEYSQKSENYKTQKNNPNIVQNAEMITPKLIKNKFPSNQSIPSNVVSKPPEEVNLQPSKVPEESGSSVLEIPKGDSKIASDFLFEFKYNLPKIKPIKGDAAIEFGFDDLFDKPNSEVRVQSNQINENTNQQILSNELRNVDENQIIPEKYQIHNENLDNEQQINSEDNMQSNQMVHYVTEETPIYTEEGQNIIYKQEENTSPFERKTSIIFQDIPRSEFKLVKERPLTPIIEKKNTNDRNMSLAELDEGHNVSLDEVDEPVEREKHEFIRKQSLINNEGRYTINTNPRGVIQLPHNCIYILNEN